MLNHARNKELWCFLSTKVIISGWGYFGNKIEICFEYHKHLVEGGGTGVIMNQLENEEE